MLVFKTAIVELDIELDELLERLIVFQKKS
jgi:hypothetical protein